MSDRIADGFWRTPILRCGWEYTPWLRDHGSLTRRIQERCTNFAVRNVQSGLASIALDESALLGLSSRERAYTREVLLLADNKPVVFAHSALAPHLMSGAWSALRTLGNKPLGALLFAHPQVERGPLRYKSLRDTHPLHQRASELLDSLPRRLWARRSLFYLRGSPLLVTEVFLPQIALLNHDVIKCR
ncbi:MAG: chorismate lyase [Gallionella sp.]